MKGRNGNIEIHCHRLSDSTSFRIRCFQDISLIIFCCAISGWNEVVYEDETTVRVQDSVHLFKEMVTSKYVLFVVCDVQEVALTLQ